VRKIVALIRKLTLFLAAICVLAMPASAATPTLESRLIPPDVLPAGIETKKWRFTTVASGDVQHLGTVQGRVAGAEVQYDNVLGYKSKTALPFDFVIIRLVRFKTEGAAHRAFLSGMSYMTLSPWGKLGQESARGVKPVCCLGYKANVVRTLWRFRDVVAVAFNKGTDRYLRERILRAQQERLR
jgi:hypothetical protein